MQSGLYGDLPAPSRPSDPSDDRLTSSQRSSAVGSSAGSSSMAPSSSSWSASASKMAPPTLRRASLFAAPPSVLRNQTTSVSKPIRVPATGTATVTATGPITVSSPVLVSASSTVMEEYDPARPNDYENYCQERRRKKMEEERQREMERRLREEEEKEKEREREMMKLRDIENAREAEREQDPNDARAKLAVSGEEAWKRRGLLGPGRGTDASGRTQRSPSPPRNGEGFLQGKAAGGLGVGAGGQMTAAERMMAKMGWKAGQGLGKQEQGITTPLMARKTDKRAGVIVNASPMERDTAAAAAAVTPGGAVKAKGGTAINGPPTRVVLLKNMVGPGEVDDELEDEVASECSKYGNVTKVLIFEITEAGFSPTEAVRIFIQFDRTESATKALIDLDGRFFGGRIVRASFFAEERFARNELAPFPGEIAPSDVN